MRSNATLRSSTVVLMALLASCHGHRQQSATNDVGREAAVEQPNPNTEEDTLHKAARRIGEKAPHLKALVVTMAGTGESFIMLGPLQRGGKPVGMVTEHSGSYALSLFDKGTLVPQGTYQDVDQIGVIAETRATEG